MPTYEYQCTVCRHRTEAFQKMSDAPLTLCPRCGHDSLRRGPGGGIGLIFKGSGFYTTDYADHPTTQKNSGGCCPCGKENGSCSTS